MSLKNIVIIELDGVVHNLSIDDAYDLWVSLGNILIPLKKDDPNGSAPKQEGLILDDINLSIHQNNSKQPHSHL
jgi:hypothetical protein